MDAKSDESTEKIPLPLTLRIFNSRTNQLADIAIN